MLAYCLLSLVWFVLPLSPPESGAAPAACRFAMQHPVDVRVELLGAVEPGRAGAAQIVVESRVGLERLQITLSATPGLRLAGPRILDLGLLPAGETVTRTVSLFVPDAPEQQYLHVLAEGKIEGRTLRRGAALNVLPHGPHHRARANPVMSKSRRILEYPGAARKIR